MSDSFDTSPTDAGAPKGGKPAKAAKAQRGPKRRSMFGVGLVLGLGLGVAGALTVPDLFPAAEPDCVRPDRVEWVQEPEGGVTINIDQAGNGTDDCNVRVVFTDPVPVQN